MNHSLQQAVQNPTSESTRRRIIGRRGINTVTWLQFKVEQAKDISPETRAHIRGQFRKLRAKHGPLMCLPDELAEQAYVRIAYRLNFMRTQEALFGMKVTDKGYHTVSKTLGIWGAATLKFKSDNTKNGKQQQNRKPVPTARMRQQPEADHEAEQADDGTA